MKLRTDVSNLNREADTSHDAAAAHAYEVAIRQLHDELASTGMADMVVAGVIADITKRAGAIMRSWGFDE